MSICLIIPALNEEKAIGQTVSSFLKLYPEITIIVSDNGSTDQTSAIAAKAGALVVSEPKRGYGAACLKAIANTPKKTSIIAFADGDFADAPEDLKLLVDPIISGEADFVLGSRLIYKQPKGALTPQARFGNWLATSLIQYRWGVTFTDLGPFRAISKACLHKLEMKDQNYGWTIEMQIRAILHDLKILEVPVHYRKRIGKSKVSGTLKGSFMAGVIILLTIYKFWWRKSV